MSRQPVSTTPFYITSAIFALLAVIIALRANVGSANNFAFAILAATFAGLVAAFPYIFELMVFRANQARYIRKLERKIQALEQAQTPSRHEPISSSEPLTSTEASLPPEEPVSTSSAPEPRSPMLKKALSHLGKDRPASPVSRLIAGQKSKPTTTESD